MSITIAVLTGFFENELDITNLDINNTLKSFYHDKPTSMGTTLKGRAPGKKNVVLRVKHVEADDATMQTAQVLNFDGFVGDEYIDEIDVGAMSRVSSIVQHPVWTKWVNACWVPPVMEEV
jgi:hypothetical protein